MTMKQTCCPFCHSAFYVTTLQLNAYKGQARCGQCHQVFDALANLIVKNTPALAPVETEETTAQDSVTAHTPQATQAAVKEDAHTVILAQNFRKASPVDEAPVPVPVASTDDDAMLFSDDQGIDEEDDAPTGKQPVSTTSSSILLDGNFDQQFLNDGIESKKDLFEKEDNSVEKLHHAADDSWIEDLLREEDEAEKKAAKQQAEQQPQRKKIIDDETTVHTPYVESFSEPKRPAYISDHEEDLLSYLNRTGVTRSQANEPATGIAEQKPASHRILQPSTQTYSSSYVFGWLGMISLMLGLFISQFIYFNFESLAINPKTAGKVEKMCSILRCNIPYMNASELKLRNLKITSTSNGYTTFRANLVNTAKMSQPFPALKLSLKRNGEVYASQIIQPRQYLPEDLKILTRLATKTPYPIEFTIKKPRSEIRDFSLQPSFK
jgi:predicted Zn finger-like uncharacterized protein